MKRHILSIVVLSLIVFLAVGSVDSKEGSSSTKSAVDAPQHAPSAVVAPRYVPTAEDQSNFDAARSKAEAAMSYSSYGMSFYYATSSITSKQSVSVSIEMRIMSARGEKFYMDRETRKEIYSRVEQSWQEALTEYGFSKSFVQVSWGGNK